MGRLEPYRCTRSHTLRQPFRVAVRDEHGDASRRRRGGARQASPPIMDAIYDRLCHVHHRQETR